jgi:uncharacterized protein YbgA (DUF1722 family)
VIGDEQVEMGLQTQLRDVLESWRGGEQAELVRIEQVRQPRHNMNDAYIRVH